MKRKSFPKNSGRPTAAKERLRNDKRATAVGRVPPSKRATGEKGQKAAEGRYRSAAKKRIKATTKTDRTGRKRQTTLRKASRRGTPAQKNVPAKRTPSLSTRVTPPKIRQGSSSNRKSSSNATPKKSLTVQERRTSQQTVESRKAISNAETTKMKLHFESNLDYQLSAIESVCDVFRGQEICRTEFTVTRHALAAQQTMAFAQSDLGIGNRLQLLDDELLKNVSEVQVRNGLRPSASLTSGDFTIEMETGTGKTYVYLRTVFELNRRYGFTKFVIVVPSVA